MKIKREINFFLAIIVIITGSKAYQHFDFQNLKFEKPVLDTIYLITFTVCSFFLVKGFFKKSDT